MTLSMTFLTLDGERALTPGAIGGGGNFPLGKMSGPGLGGLTFTTFTDEDRLRFVVLAVRTRLVCRATPLPRDSLGTA